MIGQAKFEFKTKDLIQLVKKELVEKLGNRELSPYDMSVPGVITTLSKISSYPNPTVKEISVEEQINIMNPSNKPLVSRSNDSITMANIGGDNIYYTYERETNSFAIYGGPIIYSSLTVGENIVNAHWTGVNIKFPFGFEPFVGKVVPYTHNGLPQCFVLNETDVTSNCVTVYMDGAITTHNLKINWMDNYEPELITVLVTASLEDSAIKKIPPYPVKSKLEFTFPTQDDYAESDIAIFVDLEVGK